MTRKTWLAVTALLIAVTTSLTAQGTARRIVPQQRGFKFVAPWRPVNVTSGTTKIVGTVVDVRQVPVSHARVRLRDLDKGVVLGQADTNDNGEYEFETLEPGTFVVEMLLPDGRVAALSNAGVLSRYETLNTVVQLPGRWDIEKQAVTISTNLASLVGRSMTSTTVAVANTNGITPADSGEPVSP